MHPLQKDCDMDLGEKLFNNYWHLVCHRKELPNDGDFLKFKTPLGDVVIFNDANELIAFDNRCAHRGTNIYLTTFGNQANTCKYHGWTYKSGKFIIPSGADFNECDIAKIDFRRFSLDWCGDFLFLGIKPLNSLYDQLNETSSIIENISFNISKCIDLNYYEFECAWTIAIENALEPYHISMVHRETLANLQLENGTNNFYGKNSVWYAPIGNNRIKNHLEKISLFFNIDFSYKGYMSIFIFPFTMISSTYGLSYSIQNFFPHQKDLNKTNFMSRFLTCNLKDENSHRIVKVFYDSSIKMNHQVFEEDHSICKTIPFDNWSTKPLDILSTQEIKITHFRKQCKFSSKDD